MASILVSSVITVLLITFITASDLSSKKCNCVHVKCKPITSKLCAHYNGKFIKQSLDAYQQCNCCPYCVIYSGLNKTCKEYSKALKIKCVYGTYCSEKDGHTCKSIFGDTLSFGDKNENNRKIWITISDKRVSKITNKQESKINSSSIAFRNIRRVTRDTTNRNTQNSIGGGSANSINSNTGPTYILNNVYSNDRNNAKSGANAPTESSLELRNNVGELDQNRKSSAGNENPNGNNEQDNNSGNAGGNQDTGPPDQSAQNDPNQSNAASDDASPPPPPPDANPPPPPPDANPPPRRQVPDPNLDSANNNNRDDTNTKNQEEKNNPPAPTNKPKNNENVQKAAAKNTPTEKNGKNLPINFVPVADNFGKTANSVEEVPIKALKSAFGSKDGGSPSDSDDKNQNSGTGGGLPVNPLQAFKAPNFF